jgi:hypothetical protein
VDTKAALITHLSPLLEPGEQIRSVTVVQIKRSAARDVAKSAVASTVLGVASLALSGGTVQAGAVFSAPPAWCVTTSERVLLIARGSGPLSARVLLSAPRVLNTARVRGFPAREVAIVDRADGSTVVRLNVGVKHAAARAIAEGLDPAQPGTTTHR